ncbi:phosphatase PAP2 family protein [Nocardia australiensis]|uniref:phosphatase PAP2 family protein n=1 Tax=Nocardia australiensis TaxID=2887191 RepID=UPI001D148A77|nr:phosphatase PAP2 family protein [Nocardia australiensis]
MHPIAILHGAIAEAVTEPASKGAALSELSAAGAVFATGMVQRGRRHISAALAVCGLIFAFAALTIQVHDNGWLTGADQPSHDWFVAHRTHWMDIAALVITDLGSPTGTVIIALVLGALLSWRARSALPVIVMVSTVGVAAAASTTMKLVVGRSRPPVTTQQILETDYSFPSGHVTATSAMLGIAVAVLMIGRSTRVRAVLVTMAVLLVALIAATRLYLGVHWLTDVIAGAILGTIFATIGASVLYALGTPVAWIAEAGRPDTGDRESSRRW